MEPTIGLYINDEKKNIFYWWEPPDDLLRHEIRSLLNEDIV
jgi:hypothetical protein